ncbi:hypothetical protein KKF91_05650, partial [Myxococcota bacterium]|nr:hypothetical protein [Myxococcota bacterium]
VLITSRSSQVSGGAPPKWLAAAIKRISALDEMSLNKILIDLALLNETHRLNAIYAADGNPERLIETLRFMRREGTLKATWPRWLQMEDYPLEHTPPTPPTQPTTPTPHDSLGFLLQSETPARGSGSTDKPAHRATPKGWSTQRHTPIERPMQLEPALNINDLNDLNDLFPGADDEYE